MQQVFAEMATEQKNDFIYYTLEIGFEMQHLVRKSLIDKPYACSFVIDRASIDIFKELNDFDGYKIFSSAVE